MDLSSSPSEGDNEKLQCSKLHWLEAFLRTTLFFYALQEEEEEEVAKGGVRSLWTRVGRKANFKWENKASFKAALQKLARKNSTTRDFCYDKKWPRRSVEIALNTPLVYSPFLQTQKLIKIERNSTSVPFMKVTSLHSLLLCLEKIVIGWFRRSRIRRHFSRLIWMWWWYRMYFRRFAKILSRSNFPLSISSSTDVYHSL